MTGDNVYRTPDNRRQNVYIVCRACRAESMARYRARNNMPASVSNGRGGWMHAATAIKLDEHDFLAGLGCTLEEIAAKLDTTPAALEMLLHRHRGIPRTKWRWNQ